MTQVHGPRPEIPEGGLARLIETEARLADAIAAAEREAAEIRRSARETVETGAAGFPALIEREAAALADRVAADRDGEIARIAREADARCRRLAELPAAGVDQLAAWVEATLLPAEAEGDAS
jgi:hypothetical protein